MFCIEYALIDMYALGIAKGMIEYYESYDSRSGKARL